MKEIKYHKNLDQLKLHENLIHTKILLAYIYLITPFLFYNIFLILNGVIRKTLLTFNILIINKLNNCYFNGNKDFI